MNRSLKLSILMALALGSTQVAAVELGQAQIKSALGQPLLVEIPVTQASPAELQSLSAQLASSDAFAKASISGGRPSIPLQFSVADANGHKVIRITSASNVDDPYLDLLVEVSSSSGSAVREVTVLLDPPSKVAKAPVSSAAHHRGAAANAPTSSTTSTPVATTSRPARTSASSASSDNTGTVKNGQYGPVTKGQSLSAVAAATAPKGVNVDQMMLALKSANPDAFYRDNINALKAGVVLRVPSRDDAMANELAAAAAAVRQQNADWRNGPTRTPISVADAGTRASTSTAPTSAANSGDKLALVPPGSDGQSAGANGKRGAANAAVREELQRSQETLSSLQQQSNDLKSRLKDLEDLNNKNQRLLSLKDDQIAELQRKLADARKSAGLPALPVGATATVASSAPKPAQPIVAASTHAPITAPALAASVAKPAAPLASTAPVTSGSANGPVLTPVPSSSVAVAPVVKPTPKPVVKPHVPIVAAPAVEETPWYMEPWAWGTGAGIVVLLGAMGLMSRRRKPTVVASKPLGTSSLADRFGTASGQSDNAIDPDQDELLDQLAENPDDISLHLELVSLYYTRRDVEHFEAAAEAMHAHITDADQPEWQDVVHMGRDLAPGHPLFAEDAVPAGTSYGTRFADTFDSEPAQSVPPPLPSQAKVSEYHFDFNLTPQQAAAETPAAAAASTTKRVADEEPVSTWHFDEPGEDESAHVTTHEQDFGELHDNPIDTKLDLARAYLDMGDPEGARAMLEEVLHEGTQMQKDVANTLMAKINR